MFAVLTGPGHDPDGDLSWGISWCRGDDDYATAYTHGLRPELAGTARVQAVLTHYTTNERRDNQHGF